MSMEDLDKVFERFFELVNQTDTSEWKESEIRSLSPGATFAINKEKTYIYQLVDGSWKMIMHYFENLYN